MLAATSCAPSEQKLFKKRKMILEDVLNKYLDKTTIEEYFGVCKNYDYFSNSEEYFSFFELLTIYINGFNYLKEEKFAYYSYDSENYNFSNIVHFTLNPYSLSLLEDKEYISLEDFKENRIYPLIIEEFAFEYCHNLKVIEIPDSVMWIDKNALSVCDSITKKQRLLTIKSLPKNLRFIGKNEVKWMDESFDLSTLKELRYLGNNVFNNSVFNNSYKVLPPKLRYLGSAFNKLLYDKNKEDIFDRIMFPETLEVINGVNIFSFKDDPYFKVNKDKNILPIKITLPKNLKYFNSQAFSIYCPLIIDFTNAKNNLKTIFPEIKNNFSPHGGFYPNKNVVNNKLWFKSDIDILNDISISIVNSFPDSDNFVFDVNSFVYKLIFPKSWQTRIEKKYDEEYCSSKVEIPDLIKSQVEYR